MQAMSLSYSLLSLENIIIAEDRKKKLLYCLILSSTRPGEFCESYQNKTIVITSIWIDPVLDHNANVIHHCFP